MGPNAPASQRRGKSVSDGFSRTSLRVFAVTTLASFATLHYFLRKNANLTNPITSAREALCFAFRLPRMTDLRYANQEMESERPVGILGEETAKQHLPRAELRDGTRSSVLAFKTLLASCDGEE